MRKQINDFLKENREILKGFSKEIDVKIEKSQASEQTKSFGEAVWGMFTSRIDVSSKSKKELAGDAAKKGAKVGAKKGADEVVKKGAQEAAKAGLKAASRKACSIF